ncbi:hypothetical protein [Streptomyces sp. NPDC093600]|uniref:hypothetical protein n=1 Tax=Streptomyces sp. NPDC093600 TaxID=3366047 RepID=UPI0038146ACF
MPAPTAATAAQPPVPAPPRGRRRAPGRPASAAGATTEPAGRASGSAGVAGDTAGDVVRWAVFCCVLVPVVLVVYGTSLAGAAGAALGLLAVTAACRVLLRRSERGLRAEATGRHAMRPPGGRRHRQG